MKRTTKYVALDVHQATTVASVREETGHVIARTVLPTEAPAIVEFFRGMRGAVHVAWEEGTQAPWLHELVAPLVDRVVVCDQRGRPRHGNKGDQVDADQLSDMLRLKALFRARAIPTHGTKVYQPGERARWLAQLADRGARFRAEALYAELDVLRALRPTAKAAMVAEARRDPAWPVLRAIPFLGPVRVALLLATMQTPWRFRTKRHLWAYAGLAVVTRSSADYTIVAGQPVRRRRAPLTRGLNRNHNRRLKDVFKGAATAATARPGPLQDFYHGMLARGMREELARVTLTRKLAALTLRLWKKENATIRRS